MSRSQTERDGAKAKITAQIADLSRLLAMMPSDETIHMQAPFTQNQVVLSEWLTAARNAFLALSLSIGRELDIQLQ
jgi:hypothetical protein